MGLSWRIFHYFVSIFVVVFWIVVCFPIFGLICWFFNVGRAFEVVGCLIEGSARQLKLEYLFMEFLMKGQVFYGLEGSSGARHFDDMACFLEIVGGDFLVCPFSWPFLLFEGVWWIFEIFSGISGILLDRFLEFSNFYIIVQDWDLKLFSSSCWPHIPSNPSSFLSSQLFSFQFPL